MEEISFLIAVQRRIHVGHKLQSLRQPLPARHHNPRLPSSLVSPNPYKDSKDGNLHSCLHLASFCSVALVIILSPPLTAGIIQKRPTITSIRMKGQIQDWRLEARVSNLTALTNLAAQTSMTTPRLYRKNHRSFPLTLNHLYAEKRSRDAGTTLSNLVSHAHMTRPRLYWQNHE